MQLHRDPSDKSAAARTGIGPHTWFAWVIVAELCFGGLLAIIMWLSDGSPHDSEFLNQQHDLHAHFHNKNNPPLPAIVQGSAVPGENAQP